MRWSRLLDTLFPPRCVSCAAAGSWWCTDCGRRVVPAKRMSGAETAGLDDLLAAAVHRDPVTHLVKALKYRHAKAVVPAMATLLRPLIRELRRECGGRLLLVPVPLHPRRLRERGHNQSALLTEAVSESNGLPVSTALVRTRYTRSQTGLGRHERRRNVDGAFEWTGASLRSTAVVLVDDVYTTGATMAACAAACRDAGATQVYGLVVGRR